MPLDAEISEANRAATARVRAIAERCSDEELRTPVGEHWTVSVVFAHLAFWDRRVLAIIDQVEREGRLDEQVVHPVANDYSLPLWLAIPPRDAARIAVETSRRRTAGSRTRATRPAQRCTPCTRAGSGAICTATSTSTRPRPRSKARPSGGGRRVDPARARDRRERRSGTLHA